MITYKCDQCEDMIEEPEERGHIIKKQYCLKCAPKIDDFFTERDKLHDYVIKIWNEGLEELKDGLNLPD